MRKGILILVVAGGVVACSGGSGGRALREAEALLESAPDSALVVVDQIREEGLQSRRAKAEYALLSARVQEAEYGFVPEADEEGLAEAAEYFEKKGSAEERLAAWSLLGKVQLADDALYRAVVSCN